MTSLPHASGWPHRRPHGPPEGQASSQPASHSNSRRKDVFPPPPKSVRIWQVQTPTEDQPEPTPPPPTPAQPLGPCSRLRTLGWVLLFLAGVLALAAWWSAWQFR